MYAVIIRQRQHVRRKCGSFICFEDNAGVIVSEKGDLKGTAILGPVALECANIWPRVAAKACSIV